MTAHEERTDRNGTIFGPPGTAFDNRIYALTIVCGSGQPSRMWGFFFFLGFQESGNVPSFCSSLSLRPSYPDHAPEVRFATKINLGITGITYFSDDPGWFQCENCLLWKIERLQILGFFKVSLLHKRFRDFQSNLQYITRFLQRMAFWLHEILLITSPQPVRFCQGRTWMSWPRIRSVWQRLDHSNVKRILSDAQPGDH